MTQSKRSANRLRRRFSMAVLAGAAGALLGAGVLGMPAWAADKPDKPKAAKKAKSSGPKVDTMAPAAADSAEVADRQTQAGPLGLAGDTASKKKKKKSATTGDKTRLTDKKKAEAPAADSTLAPAPAPQPAPAPAPAPQQ